MKQAFFALNQPEKAWGNRNTPLLGQPNLYLYLHLIIKDVRFPWLVRPSSLLLGLAQLRVRDRTFASTSRISKYIYSCFPQ
jgi:hypothetical protein